MADEIKLKAPTVEQQVVVNINGEDKLKSFADTLDKISNNKNLQKYWKTQQDLINATADAYGNFQKKASKDNASELIKVTNALKAMSGTDLSHILPDFDKISKGMAEAQKVAGNIDSAFSVKGFKEAFDSFETLKAYGTDIQKLFSHFGVSSDIGELQKNVRLLESEVEKLTRKLSNARNTNEELRNEFENFKVGSGFADKLDELDRLKAEMQNIRDEATQTFNQFLDVNKIDRYDWFDDDRFAEYFKKLENGTLTASEAIRQFKTEYDYLLEESFKSNGNSFGLDQLQAFSTKLDSIFQQVEETSNKINDILSNGVIAKSVQNLSEDTTLSDSQRSIFGNILQDEESLKSVTALFQKLIDETNQTKNTEVFNTEQFTKLESLFTSIESSLSSIKGVLVDVGDGEELSPLLKTIANIESAIDNLSSSVKGIGLNMNIDFGSDTEMEAKAQAKISNALQAYQNLFEHIKMSSAGGSLITQKFFDFDINQFDTPMSKLQAYIKFIKDMREETKKMFGGHDVLFEDTDKQYWTKASSAMGQVTRVFNEMKTTSDTNPLTELFGKTDLSGVIEQLNTIVSKLDEISVSAKEFTETFKNGLNVNASVEEIEKLTNRVKELEDELARVKAPTIATTPQESDISSDISSQVKVSDNITDQIIKNEKKKQDAYKATTEMVMYHAGIISKLNKAETNGQFYGSDRNTGYFGTGHYFVDANTKHELDDNDYYSSLPYTSIDISKYDNLFKATTDEIANALHTFLKNLTQFTQGSDLFDISELFSQFQKVFGESTMDMQEFDEKLSYLKTYMQNSDMFDRGDSVSTQFMKSLGYGGVDTRGTNYADTRYGTVIYDLKEESILQSNITDELQKQSQMLEKINYEKGQVFDKSEDAKIQNILDQQAKSKEIEIEFNKIFDSTNLNTYENELESVNQKLSENQNIIDNCNSAIKVAEEDAREYARDMAEIGKPIPDEKLNEIVKNNKLEYQERIEELSKEQSLLKDRKQEIESNLDAEYKLANAARERATATVEDRMKDAFPKTDTTASVEKIADGFKEVKQNTEQATEVTEKYQRVLSQVGELGVDAKVSAMYQRNDGQLESVSWKAKRDDQGQILYDKNGNIDYDFNSTVISKYEQLEKIITTADNKLRDLQKSLKDTQNLNSNASTKNIEEQIQYQKDYIQLLEQTVKAISQQDEYLLYEQQIIDARAKAEKEYNLNQGTKSDISNAKQLASDEQKRQKSIEQTNRLLNKQQIIIDGIEKSYSKAANNDLDKAVNSQSDLAELEKKKNLIQFLLNGLKNEDRNSSNEKEFLQVEKLIAEYKQLAKDKLKANNPSKQELGGQELDVLLANQVTQYNKLISQSEKYGDATKEITNELKAQRDLIAEQDKNGVYVARSKKDDGSEITANDYYNARDNYKINKSIFNSYEDNIKNGAQSTAKQQTKSIKEEWTNALKTVKEYETAVSKLNNLKASDKGLETKTADIKAQQKKIDDMKSSFESAQATILSFFSSTDKFNSLPVSSIKEVQDAIKLIQTAANGSTESVSRLEDALRNMQETSIGKLEKTLSNYQGKVSGYKATIDKFGDDGWTSPEYSDNVQRAQQALKAYEDEVNKLKANPDLINKESLANVEKLGKDFEEATLAIKNMTAAQKGYTQLGAEKAMDKISQMLKENSKMSRQAKADIKAWYDQIKSGNPSASLDVILGKVEEIVRKEKEAGRGGKSMWDAIKEKAFYSAASVVGTYFGLNDIIRYGKEGIDTIRELDTALTEMRKVSDESLQSLKKYQSTTFDTADAVGTTAKQIQESTADYMRLGESLDEAAESAKTANILLNVSEFDNIEDATKSLVSMGQAYKDLDKLTIVDKLNEVGKIVAQTYSNVWCYKNIAW